MRGVVHSTHPSLPPLSAPTHVPFTKPLGAASSSMQGLTDTARHVIHRMLHPRLLSQTASYDVASSICQALCLSRHPTHI
jgi:hypothetical protein